MFFVFYFLAAVAPTHRTPSHWHIQCTATARLFTHKTRQIDAPIRMQSFHFGHKTRQMDAPICSRFICLFLLAAHTKHIKWTRQSARISFHFVVLWSADTKHVKWTRPSICIRFIGLWRYILIYGTIDLMGDTCLRDRRHICVD